MIILVIGWINQGIVPKQIGKSIILILGRDIVWGSQRMR